MVEEEEAEEVEPSPWVDGGPSRCCSIPRWFMLSGLGPALDPARFVPIRLGAPLCKPQTGEVCGY